MTSPEQHRRLKDLVEAALEKPAGERSAFLAAECAKEPALLQQAEDLLAVYSDEDPAPEAEHIGPYRIIKELGVGGMGVVYLAEREGDYHRRVAMKVIRRGMDTDFFLGRFLKEREILGALDHPGVVRIVDAGSTLDGRPYLVMDYVDGIRIDKFCEENIISTNDRLKIFIKVCSAVQHAHRNLIVHRDLKPGNILVTPEGDPKLLDFGIAKVVDENDERTQLTIPIMTRQYASPEQVKGKRITTSCDIYALGLILYEMLTGERPYDLKDKPVDEVERIVCTIDPPPPSALAGESTTRHTLRGDLDRIVMMALRKEPERRYGSVEAMARDLTRYLDGRPVSAQRDTWHYRAGKFIQRNRGPLALASVVAATALGGTVGILWQANIARAERGRGDVQMQRAEDERHRAEARFADVRALANSLLFDLHSSIRELPGSAEAQRLLLTNAVKYTERLAEDSGNDPTLLSDLALAYERIGLLQSGSPEASSSLGDTAGALINQNKALAIRTKLVASDPTNAAYQADLAASYVRLAEIQHLLNRPDEELDFARKSLATTRSAAGYRSLASALAAKSDLTGALAAIHQQIALENNPLTSHEAREQEAAILERQGRFAQALGLVRANTPIFEHALEQNPHNLRLQRLLIDNQRRAASLAERTGDLASAKSNYRKALDWQIRLADQDPQNIGLKEALADVRLNLATTLERLGETEAALEETSHAVVSLQELSAHDPSNQRLQTALVSAWRRHGQLLLEHKSYNEAALAFRKSLASSDPLTRALSSIGLGEIERDQNRLPQAAAHFKSAIQTLQAQPARDFRTPGNLAVAHNRLGEVQYRMGQPASALTSYQTAASLAQRLLSIDPNNTWARTVQAEAHSRQGEIHQASNDWKNAIADYQTSAKADEALAQSDPHDTQARRNAADSRYHLCLAQMQLDQNPEALASCKAAIDHWTALLPNKAAHADLAYGYEKSGEIYLKMAHSDEACRLFVESQKQWRQADPANPSAADRVEQRLKSCPAVRR